jgi:acetate kinase
LDVAILMANALLVLNAGSSSLKFSVFPDQEELEPLLRGAIDGLSTQPRFVARDARSTVAQKEWPAGTRLSHQRAIEFLFSWGRSGVLGGHRIGAVGHRVVHGGTHLTAPCVIDAAILAELETLVPLAPLHQPHNIAAIKAVAQMAPALPQVACFDTAFHHTQPATAQAFALPRRFADEGVRRYGFHGLSYEYVASALASLDPRGAEGRTIVAHLGNGASLCAMRSRRSIATTMGFTALDGLVMGTRCGAIDPGVLLYLIDRHGLGARDLQSLLYERSGLLGLSDISSDMRALLASSDPRAGEAIDVFVYRIQREIGSLAAALGGLDTLVFTGGIGEHAAAIRDRICRDASWLGVDLDAGMNAKGAECISRGGSSVTVWVIPTNEERMIARHTRRVLAEISSLQSQSDADAHH